MWGGRSFVRPWIGMLEWQFAVRWHHWLVVALVLLEVESAGAVAPLLVVVGLGLVVVVVFVDDNSQGPWACLRLPRRVVVN